MQKFKKIVLWKQMLTYMKLKFHYKHGFEPRGMCEKKTRYSYKPHVKNMNLLLKGTLKSHVTHEKKQIILPSLFSKNS